MLRRFLQQRITRTKGASVKAADLYQTYAAWCLKEHQIPFNSNRFGNVIAAEGIEKIRSNGIRYVGVELTKGSAAATDAEGVVA